MDAQGSPFLIIGDSAWATIHRMTMAEVDAYIADRVSRGFNSAMIMLIRQQDTVSGGTPPTNAYGERPFTTTPWLVPANVNEAYFARADQVIKKFEAANMLVMLAYCYSGGGDGDGFWANLTSDTVAQSWGAWIGARYNTKAFPNIIWVSGGDRRVPDVARARAMADALRDAGGTQLHTYHMDRYHNAMESGYFSPDTTDDWLTLNNVYTDDGSTAGYGFYQQGDIEWRRSPVHPYFLIEDWYMDEHGLTDAQVIVEKWQALLSGCCGANTGTSAIWYLPTDYEDEFGSPANVGVSKIGPLMAQYQWHTLVPKNLTNSGASDDNSLVSSAKGSGATRITCALGDDPNGKFAMAIVPSATSPTVVMTSFTQSSVRARWYDIGNGSFTNVSGQPFANTGSRSMMHPGNNSLGSAEWVLVLDPA